MSDNSDAPGQPAHAAGFGASAPVAANVPPYSPLNAKHERLRRHLLTLLDERGRHLTPVQEAVVQTFLAREGHAALDALLDSIRAEFPETPMATVKTTMDLLVEMGVARSFIAQNERVYEHEHLNEHHDHLVCVKCGAIQEFVDGEIEERQTRAASRQGFRPFFHRLTIHGLCRHCLDEAPSYLPLTEAPAGRAVTIEAIEGGAGLVARLNSMGLTRGARVEVVGGAERSHGGPVIVMTRGARLALGRGMAMKVLVAAAGNGARPNHG